MTIHHDVAPRASTNSETAAPLDSTLLESLGVHRREIQIAAPFLVSYLFILVIYIYLFFFYFLFDILI